MHLTKEEERALAGKNGEAIAAAYRILAAIGEATDADRLVPVEWAHVSGVNYNTIGDAGVQFLEEFSNLARVAIRTTVNPMGYDADSPDSIPEKFRHEQQKIVASYQKLGVIPSFTCTPYEVFGVPPKGTQVSFAESNAAVYSNSVLGLKTNKESALSALASSVTGKAPLSELRIEELRKPRIGIIPGYRFSSELDYGLLGYFAGKVAKDSSSVSISCEKNTLDRVDAKALSAGMGTSGSCGMYVIGEAKEKVGFGIEEKTKLLDELDTSEKGDIIALGSPQLGLDELRLVASSVQGKKFDKRCLIFCSRAIYKEAAKIGLAGEIERSGAEVKCDSCTCLTPYVARDRYDSVTTNSVKSAYYFNHSSKLGVELKDIKTICEEHTS
ncbi:MAG: aconitase X catalytic domain-containing protein [Nitrososphaera sp.]|jgi:predicted aconitase